MNLFGSRKQKEEKDYRYLADILKTSDMDTEDKILDHLKKVNSRALNATVLLALIIGSLCLLWGKYIPIWGITGLMCLAWIWRSALVARRIMHRYIEEEIKGKNNDGAADKTDSGDQPSQSLDDKPNTP